MTTIEKLDAMRATVEPLEDKMRVTVHICTRIGDAHLTSKICVTMKSAEDAINLAYHKWQTFLSHTNETKRYL